MSTRIANIFYDCKGKEKNVQTKEKQEKTHADCANYAVPYLFDPLNMSTENYPPNLLSQTGWGILFQYRQMNNLNYILVYTTS